MTDAKKPEPVAWWNGNATVWFDYELMGMPAPDGCTMPLYAEPPRREWVGLTDCEIQRFAECIVDGAAENWIIAEIEAALKAKNT